MKDVFRNSTEELVQEGRVRLRHRGRFVRAVVVEVRRAVGVRGRVGRGGLQQVRVGQVQLQPQPDRQEAGLFEEKHFELIV